MKIIAYTEGFIETQILMDYRSGVPDAVDFIVNMRQLGPLKFSELSAMHLISDCPDAIERSALVWFFYGVPVYAVSASISHRARAILQALPPPSVLSPADAIIAATALIHKLPLYALDPGRFGIVPGLNCIQPY